MRCALANNASFLLREYTTGRKVNETWPALRLDQRKCSLAITNQLVEIRLPVSLFAAAYSALRITQG